MPFLRSLVVAMRAGQPSCRRSGGSRRGRRRRCAGQTAAESSRRRPGTRRVGADGPVPRPVVRRLGDLRGPSAPTRRSDAGDDLEGHPVAVDAPCPAITLGGVRRDHRGVPELLRAAVRVGEVHLDQRRGQLGAGVEQRVASSASRPPALSTTGVRVVGGLVEPVEQLALVVGLPHLDLEPEVAAPAVAQRRPGRRSVVRAVDLRLPPAEPAEVRAVEHQHPHRPTSPARDHVVRRAQQSPRSGAVRIAGRASPSSTTNRSWSPRAFLSTCIAVEQLARSGAPR